MPADSHISSLDAVSEFWIGGVKVLLTAAEMNTLHALGLAGTGGFFDHTATRAEVNAGHIVVPAIVGKQFYPTFGMFQCLGGAGTASTLLRLVESASGGVVLSHVIADAIENAWLGPTGGTVVTTLLNTALTVSEGIKIDQTGTALATATTVRAIIAGYYI